MEIERPKKSETMNLLRTFKALSVAAGTTERPSNATYINQSESFLLKDKQKDYTKQYWKTYYQRLSQIKEYIFADLQSKGITACERILNIKVGEPQIVIATLYKQMKLKPSVLSQQSKGSNAGASSADFSANYMQEDDQIFMEDSTGRMQLAFNGTRFTNPVTQETRMIDVEHLTTGIIVGIKGIQRAVEVNVFEVEEIFACGLPHQESILKIAAPLGLGETGFLRHGNNIHDLSHYYKNPTEANFVLLTSGLNLSLVSQHSSVNLLKHHILGLSNLTQLMSRVSRVIIAGNLIEKNKDLDYNMVGAYSKQEEFKNVYADINAKMRHADSLINSIASHVCLDIMPGDNDPTQAFLPQQPISHYYFLKSIQTSKKSLFLVSNPYKFEQEGISVLGFSGQALNDSKKSCKFSENDIDVLESHLLWRHIAPTAPDTLQCFPFIERDPFVVDELPHVYFSGNSEKFQTKVLYEPETNKRCRLICVPALSSSNSVVLLNLQNLDTFEISL